MILQSFRWNILCCHVRIPQSHKNMYWLISTLIRYFRILCTNYTHSNRVEMLLPQKSFTTAAYWQRTHGTAAPRGCEARGWARGTESRRTDERWDILAELLPRQETLSWPARAAPAASFSLLHSPHHTTLFCLTLLTPSTFMARSSYMWSHPSHKIPQHNAHWICACACNN